MAVAEDLHPYFLIPEHTVPDKEPLWALRDAFILLLITL